MPRAVLLGQVQVQRRHRDMIAIDRAQVAVGRRHRLAAAQSDPVIGALAGIDALLDLGGLQIVFALRHHLDALHRIRGAAAGKLTLISVPGPARLHQAADTSGPCTSPGDQSIAWRSLSS